MAPEIEFPDREWATSSEDAPLVAHPAPECPVRLAEVQEVPRGAKTLQRGAEGAGWTVLATYARGTNLVRGKPGRVVHSLALRMRHQVTGYRAVAVYVTPLATGTTTCDGCWYWRPGASLPIAVGVTELKIAFLDPEVIPNGIPVASSERAPVD